MRDIILSVDPGVTSGFSVMEIVEGVGVIRSGLQTKDHIEALLNYYKYFEGNKNFIVVCETFKALTMGVKTTSLEGFGAAQMLAAAREVEFYRQNPDIRMFALKRYPEIRSWYDLMVDLNYVHFLDASMHAIVAAYQFKKVRTFDWSESFQVRPVIFS